MFIKICNQSIALNLPPTGGGPTGHIWDPSGSTVEVGQR